MSAILKNSSELTKIESNLSWVGLFFAGIVLTLGAFTRLMDAGLGCPDWPGCYGLFTVPDYLNNIETRKAWIEMIHRYFASSLGFIILILNLASFYRRKINLFLLFLLILVIAQGTLGMLTVTLKLYPIIVTSHLMGGIFIISLIWAYIIKTNNKNNSKNKTNFINNIATLALIAVYIQIFLGGWMAANNAALVCLDFPTCNNKLIPELSFIPAFNLLNKNLNYHELVTIHMLHRWFAMVVLVIVGFLAHNTKNIFLAGILFLQIAIGILNIILALPVPIAVLHHFMALLILMTVIHEKLS